VKTARLAVVVRLEWKSSSVVYEVRVDLAHIEIFILRSPSHSTARFESAKPPGVSAHAPIQDKV
jgi:hypothetical protein